MVYLAHFSFEGGQDSADDHEDAFHGRLTCVTSAESVDEAMDSFRNLLRALREMDDEEPRVDVVYLEMCLALPSVPERGLISYEERAFGPPTGRLFRVLPISHTSECRVYGMPESEHEVMEAFLTFERPDGRPASAAE